jgi:hypothetical protein
MPFATQAFADMMINDLDLVLAGSIVVIMILLGVLAREKS